MLTHRVIIYRWKILVLAFIVSFLLVSIPFVGGYRVLSSAYNTRIETRGHELTRELTSISSQMPVEQVQLYLENRFNPGRFSYMILMDESGNALAHCDSGRVGMNFFDPDLPLVVNENKAFQKIYTRDKNDPTSPHHGDRLYIIAAPCSSIYIPNLALVSVGISYSFFQSVKHRFIIWGIAGGIFILLVILVVFMMLLKIEMERDQALNAFRKSEEKYQMLVEQMRDIPYRVSKFGEILYIGPQIEQYGYLVTESIGEKIYDLIDPRDRDIVRGLFKGSMMKGKMKRIVFRLNIMDGEDVWFESQGNFFYSDKHEVLGSYGVLREVTERKILEDQVRLRLDSLTRPFGENSAISFNDLFVLDEIQKIQDLFANTMNIASIITKPDGTPITRASSFTDVCKLIRGTKQGLRNCKNSDAFLGKYSQDGPHMLSCLSCGLKDASVNIVVNGVHIANWLIGQVKTEEIDDAQLLAYADELGIDKKTFEKVLPRVPCMSTKRFQMIIEMLYQFANQLSQQAFFNVQQARMISQLKHVQEQVKSQEENLRIILQSIGDAVIATDIHGCITHMNPVAERLTGWALNEGHAHPLSEVFQIFHAKSNERVSDPVEKVLETGEVIGLANHTALKSKNGEVFQIADSGAPIKDQHGNIQGVVLVFRDVTEEYALQEKLKQSQKMDVVGQLAGGVAHDFNNMLAGIMGNAELLQLSLNPNASVRKYADLILLGAQRAADLTRKLLTFSRKSHAVFRHMDIHDAIQMTIQLLKRTIDRKITIISELNASPSTLFGDCTLIENMLLNLALNARDAMTDGGSLTFSTSNIFLKKEQVTLYGFDIEAGDFLEISVMDTGIGMGPDVCARIFEPFFTTKEVGEGTGLGLSAVYGAVKEHHGMITVYSEVGACSVFEIYLPVAKDTTVIDLDEQTEIQKGQGTILIIDDEPIILHTAQALLTSLGYQVIEAPGGTEGIDLYNTHRNEIDLVLLDMVMPELSGMDVFQQL